VRSLLCSSALALVLSHACAHDLGCDGKPPDAAIKQSCCGDHDWLRLQAGMWKQDGNVYLVLIDSKWEPVVGYDNKPIEPLPSTDGCDYVWFRRQGENGYWNDDETAHAGSGVIHFFCLQLNMAF
jgi:hypothetical protein